MDTKPTATNYCNLLGLLLRAKHGLMRITESHGLTVMQAHVLALVEPGRPVAMSKLSTALACDASNITGIVDRLTSQRLLTRTEDAKDRRVKMIALTDDGTAKRQALVDELSQAMGRGVETALSPAEQDTLYRLLLKIQQANPTA
jgi:DNA-binding MarR family transcriptional regulator